MTQPEALRLADEMERVAEYDHQVQAAAEIRRLHEANQELLKALKAFVEDEDARSWGVFGIDGRSSLKRAKAIIKKAEGK